MKPKILLLLISISLACSNAGTKKSSDANNNINNVSNNSNATNNNNNSIDNNSANPASANNNNQGFLNLAGDSGQALSNTNESAKEEWDNICDMINSGELDASCTDEASFNTRFECTLGSYHGSSALTACMAALSLKRKICTEIADRSRIPSPSTITCGIHAATDTGVKTDNFETD
jgi:hypothetical protein